MAEVEIRKVLGGGDRLENEALVHPALDVPGGVGLLVQQPHHVSKVRTGRHEERDHGRGALGGPTPQRRDWRHLLLG